MESSGSAGTADAPCGSRPRPMQPPPDHRRRGQANPRRESRVAQDGRRVELRTDHYDLVTSPTRHSRRPRRDPFQSRDPGMRPSARRSAIPFSSRRRSGRLVSVKCGGRRRPISGPRRDGIPRKRPADGRRPRRSRTARMCPPSARVYSARREGSRAPIAAGGPHPRERIRHADELIVGAGNEGHRAAEDSGRDQRLPDPHRADERRVPRRARPIRSELIGNESKPRGELPPRQVPLPRCSVATMAR